MGSWGLKANYADNTRALQRRDVRDRRPIDGGFIPWCALPGRARGVSDGDKKAQAVLRGGVLALSLPEARIRHIDYRGHSKAPAADARRRGRAAVVRAQGFLRPLVTFRAGNPTLTPRF